MATHLEETAARVLEAARAIGRRSGSLPGARRKGGDRTIGLIIPDISDAYFYHLAVGVEDTARTEGFVVSFCNTDRDPEKELLYLDILRDKQVAGVIFAGGGVDDDEHLRGRDWAGANVVLLGPHGLRLPSIGVDNRGAAAAAVRHLAEQDCRQIACIGGQPNWLIHQVRLDGVREGLAEVGGELRPELVWLGDFRFQSGYDAVEGAVGDGLEFDGIVAFNDYSALGAMQALRAHGREIPGDVAAVGFDDIPIATLVDPQLSSVAFPLREMGEAAAHLALRTGPDDAVAEPVIFPFELKVRGTSSRNGGG